jgi:hypothetical protein
MRKQFDEVGEGLGSGEHAQKAGRSLKDRLR